MTTGARAIPRVLIVDDDPSIRRGLRNLLEDEDFEVVGEALDGADALGVADQSEPDLVLMDLRMPVMGGIEATRQLTAAFPTIQVIVCTAYDDPSLHQGAMEAGAFAVLVKGCSPRLVLEVVEQAWVRKQELDLTVSSVEHADGWGPLEP
jgi:DNA-binding NarL/FixJ family response regulator